MRSRRLAAAIAKEFPTPFLRGYVRTKIATDPVYAAVATALSGHAHPLLDIGCGVGIMSFYLRACGFALPIRGIDHDAKKIDVARTVAAQYQGLEFTAADARTRVPAGFSVLLIDVLHYLDDAQQKALLADVVDAVPEGGVVIIRDGLRDGSWRYRLTYAAEAFARAIRWLKAERLNFPTMSTIRDALPGFEISSRPLWGSTPFNNYLFVARRSSEGMTKR